MSPAPQPPKKPAGGPAPRPGAPKPPQRPPAARGGDEHPAERLGQHPAERGGPPGQAERAGKYFEIRKGKSGTPDALKEEDDPLGAVALPRSITQEQEQADLKARLGREELVDIDKKNALVQVKDAASEPSPLKKRSSQIWLLIIVILIAGAAIAADKFHLLDMLKGH